jgi:hypothetical protein
VIARDMDTTKREMEKNEQEVFACAACDDEDLMIKWISS